jgi:hypothetical protein
VEVAMTVRLQVVFEGEDMADLVASVRRWLASQPDAPAADDPGGGEFRRREVEAVLAGIRGEDTRRLLLELAVVAESGRGLSLDDLKGMFDKPTGNAFGGVVGAANKVSRRIAQRDLILRDGGGYRLDERDAVVIRAAGGR